MIKQTSAAKALSVFLIALCLMLPGCSRPTGITPSADEIKALSAAAGFLAQKAETSSGFIAADDQRDKASGSNAYLYDNSLAVMALVSAGAQQHAEIIGCRSARAGT